MPRSLEEIIAHADELADAFEDYDPQLGDEGGVTPGSLRLIAYRRAQAERELADAGVDALVRTVRRRRRAWHPGVEDGAEGERRGGREGPARSAEGR